MRKIDLSGKRYGRLLVLGMSSKIKHGHTVCECVCDCGNLINVGSDRLKTGNTASCGCLHAEHVINMGKANRRADRFKTVTTAFYKQFLHYTKRIKRRCDVPYEMFMKLVQSNCSYCGVEPSNVFKYQYSDETFRYSGIDRVDSSIDYLVGNVVSCCRSCNIAKNDMTLSQFTSWVTRVYKQITPLGEMKLDI